MTDHLYRPGSWFALVAPRAALLVDGEFPLDRLASLWEACRNRPTLNELMNLVSAGQLMDLPGFALAVADADQVRVIVRAGVSAVGSDLKGDPRTVDGGSVSTWVEDALAAGSRVRLTRAEAKADGVTLPVSGGVVMAEELWWQPEELPVEEVQAAPAELVGAAAGGVVLNGGATGGVALNGGAPVPVGAGMNGMHNPAMNGAMSGTGMNGMHNPAMNGAMSGTGMNGMHNPAMNGAMSGAMNGAGMNGMNGAGMNGAADGPGMNGVGVNGPGVNGPGVNGNGMNGPGMNGNGMNGAGMNGAGMNGNGMNGGDGNGFVSDPSFDLGGRSDLERLLASGRNATEAVRPGGMAQQPAGQPMGQPANEPMTQVVGVGQSGLPVRPVAHAGMGAAAPSRPAPGNPGMGGAADRTGDIRALREPGSLVPARGGRSPQAPQAPVGDSPTTVFKAPDVTMDDPSMVMGVTCRYGHVNPPQQGRCRVCGVEVPFQQPTPQQRPSLGTLRFSTGQTVTLDRPVIIGRAPYADRVAGGQIPRLVRLDDEGQLISRSHVEVRLDGWNVVLEDLNSANGTYLTEPGRHPEQVEPGDGYVLEPGTEVALSQHISFIYEVGE
ncbi:FHA domain-containing protein [Spongisporangium articulatum]|uniref:FHA domain-containing protein n=1 Tax=Spongisporangium articulatum TaxID=3362603 RepID=A0ABW8APF1_9ACTN